MLFSERLKKIRKACGLSQAEVAQALGVERTTYTYYELGQHEPNIARIKDIAKLFNMDVAALLGENDEFVGNFMLADEGVEYGEPFDRLNELKKDEIMLLLYYRRLDKSKQAKLVKSIKEKYNK